MPANRNKLAFYYFISAVGLFAVGYGLAWFSETPFFAKDVFPKHAAKSSATPEPKEITKDKETPSSKPGKQYEVQPGDTISAIAGKEGVSSDELADYNGVPYPYNLTPGQILIIPGK